MTPRPTIARTLAAAGAALLAYATTSVLYLLLSLGVALLAVSCASAKESIGRAAAVVSAESVSGRRDLDAARATGDVGREAVPYVVSASDRFGRIHDAADGIADALPGVRDREAPWYIRRWYVALGLLAVAGVALYSLAPHAIAWLAMAIPALAFTIPRRIRASAKMLREVVEDRAHAREAVAAQRANSPMFDAAYRLEKRP